MRKGRQLLASLIAAAFAVISALSLSYMVRAEPSVNQTVNRDEDQSVERPPVQAAEQKRGELRVVTFNMRHAKGMDGRVNINRTLQLLKRTEADVIALQEVDRYRLRSGFQDQAAYLAKNLGMDWRFSASLDGAVNQYGNAILSRYPIIDQEVKYLPGQERRSVLQVRIREGGQLLSVVTTHLSVHVEERQRQMPLLLDFLSAVHGAAVLTGDFNMETANTLMWGLQDEWRQANLQQPARTVAGGGQFDHIFLKGPLHAARTQNIAADVSDHFPVVADLVK